ncbi:GxxExxY protein [Kaistella flava (ex Peng et al. 2021)]|uniref:GxxExxY protein n=1 Tax=Kaistella flava (ex Peng et al. 2021) TaxID=2038776 RepID=A0A7M2Y6H4_9FLAO|nr:GxxExxY protein [Kaistella flava (ex Peng et al. 2021)]QOW08953.1 GxxExxY protein [Kaistella flava (ex Peng et al. 2021)]
MITQKYITDLTYKINGACIEVHKILGSGLAEIVYHKALEEEFRIRDIQFKSEFVIPVFYKDKNLECDFKCDFLVEDLIVLEIKAVTQIMDIHKSQVLNYMNLLKVPKGILINFNVKNIYHFGQETFINKYFDQYD